MKNPTYEQKLEMCFYCSEYINKKCKHLKCMNCFNAMLYSKFGKCPKNKWLVEIPKELIE